MMTCWLVSGIVYARKVNTILCCRLQIVQLQADGGSGPPDTWSSSQTAKEEPAASFDGGSNLEHSAAYSDGFMSSASPHLAMDGWDTCTHAYMHTHTPTHAHTCCTHNRSGDFPDTLTITRFMRVFESLSVLKLNVGNIHRYTPIRLYPEAPLYNIITIVDTVLGRNEISNTKGNEVNNIAILTLWHAWSRPARR